MLRSSFRSILVPALALPVMAVLVLASPGPLVSTAQAQTLKVGPLKVGPLMAGPVLGEVLGIPVTGAQQQRRDPISSFFNSLFGGLSRKTRPARTTRTPQRNTGGGSGVTRVRTAPAQPKAAQKAEDAKQVAVFGDFFAEGLEEGLTEAFLESSSVLVEGQDNASSGLVRADHFNWPSYISGWLNDPAKKTDLAVIMIGANDRQALSDETGEHAPLTERWRELYAEKIDAVIELFAQHDVPLYWVSLPPVASGRMSQDYAHFNEIYRERAYRHGIEFVDIWNSFVDEQGNYAAVGPDINGERRQLRAEDGLHFTPAGNRKLAHFVAREIRRDFGREGGLFLALPEGETGPQPFMPSDDEIRTGVGQVVALTGAQGGTATTLAGGPDKTPEPPRDSPYYQVILEGEAPETLPGRADDFSWPPKRVALPDKPVMGPDMPAGAGPGTAAGGLPGEETGG